MALLDFILDRTGAIGAKFRGARSAAYAREVAEDIREKNQRVVDKRNETINDTRDDSIMRKPRSPRHTTIITADSTILSFDATTSLSHQFSSTVTSYSVEDRSTVSDHVVNNNPKFSLSGVFSDASAPENPNNTTSEVKTLLNSSGQGANKRQHQYNQAETYRLLLDIRDAREVITLVTPIDTYTDLILTDLTIPRATGQGRALFVDMTFEKIRRVSNELTTVFIGSSGKGKKVPETEGTTATKTAKEKDAGSKPPTTVEPVVEKKEAGMVKTVKTVATAII